MQQIIDQVVCLNLDCSIWSGRKKLTPADFKNTGSDDLPPADLASLGSKKICNPAALRIFDTLKKEAHREAAKVGIRFLGGYAIPASKAEALAEALDDVRSRFDEARTKFLDGYDDEIKKWIAKHPKWASSISAVVPSASHVESRISFDYQAFEVKASGVAAAGLTRAVNGLADQLYHEIAREAWDYYDISLCGKPKGTQKTLRPLRSIRSKLDGLSFIDNTVFPIIELIDNVLASMPAKGDIEGTDLVKLVGVVHILYDKDRMLAYAQGVLNGDSQASLLDAEEDDTADLLAAAPPVQTTVTQPDVDVLSGANAATDNAPAAVQDLSIIFATPPAAITANSEVAASTAAETLEAQDSTVEASPQVSAEKPVDIFGQPIEVNQQDCLFF